MWLAFREDLAGAAVFTEELDALRYAVAYGNGMVVRAVQIGEDFGLKADVLDLRGDDRAGAEMANA